MMDQLKNVLRGVRSPNRENNLENEPAPGESPNNPQAQAESPQIGDDSGTKSAGTKVRPGQRFLTEEELRSGKHRKWVGGDWERKGKIQVEFMKRRGLEPHHKFLDVGCGVLRGGLHLIDYLERGNYYGIEAKENRVAAGRWELQQAELEHKKPNLLANEDFEVERFGETFDYALALSLFTHLDLNHIVRCLHEVGNSLGEQGEFYASFLEAPGPAHLEPIPIGNGGKMFTNYDSNPYHYAFSELEWAARNVGLRAEYIGAWEHPGQNMILVTRG